MASESSTRQVVVTVTVTMPDGESPRVFGQSLTLDVPFDGMIAPVVNHLMSIARNIGREMGAAHPTIATPQF